MEKEKLRQLLSARIEDEYAQFKESMLNESKGAIYEYADRIYIYDNMQNILITLIEYLEQEVLNKLNDFKHNLLDLFYDRWLKLDDNFYNDLYFFAQCEIDRL